MRHLLSRPALFGGTERGSLAWTKTDSQGLVLVSQSGFPSPRTAIKKPAEITYSSPAILKITCCGSFSITGVFTAAVERELLTAVNLTATQTVTAMVGGGLVCSKGMGFGDMTSLPLL